MSLVATFTVPGAQFPLTRALYEDALRVELDRVEPVDGSVVSLLFWLYGDDATPDRYADHLTVEDGVRDVIALDRLDDRVLFRAEYAREGGDLLDILLETDADILTAAGTTDATRFVVRFPSDSAAEAFLSATDRYNLPVGDLQTFSAAGDFDEEEGFDLVGFLFDLDYFDGANPPTLDAVATSLSVTPDDVRDAYDRVKPY